MPLRQASQSLQLLVDWGWMVLPKEVPEWVPVSLEDLKLCRSPEEAEPYWQRLTNALLIATSPAFQTDRVIVEYRKNLEKDSTASCARELWPVEANTEDELQRLQRAFIENGLPYYYSFGRKEDIPKVLELFKQGLSPAVQTTIDGWRLEMLLELVCAYPVCGEHRD